MDSSSVLPYTSRQGSATLNTFPPQWWVNSASVTDLPLHLLKIFMGPDLLEHFYDPEPTGVTNHCHHRETNPASSVTQGVSRFAQLWCSGVSVCWNEEGFKYLSVWKLDHQCLRCPLSGCTAKQPYLLIQSLSTYSPHWHTCEYSVAALKK